MQPNTPIEPTICIALRNRNTISSRQKRMSQCMSWLFNWQIHTTARQSIANSSALVPFTTRSTACHQAGKVIDVVEREGWENENENEQSLKPALFSQSASHTESDRSRQLLNSLQSAGFNSAKRLLAVVVLLLLLLLEPSLPKQAISRQRRTNKKETSVRRVWREGYTDKDLAVV